MSCQIALHLVACLLLALSGCGDASPSSQHDTANDRTHTRPTVAEAEKGPWSEIDNGIRCRILYAEQIQTEDQTRRHYRLWIEIENIGNQDCSIALASSAGMPYIGAYCMDSDGQWRSDQHFLLEDDEFVMELSPGQSGETIYRGAFDDVPPSVTQLQVSVIGHGSSTQTQSWSGKIRSGTYSLSK